MREYPEIKKTFEIVSQEEYFKDFKLNENAEEEIQYIKLTKELKYVGYSKKKVPNGLGMVFHQSLPLFYGLFKVFKKKFLI